ncbi:hypothetical protein B0H17DRAFT_152570 [Mycena rosella]|uniref:Uncharacterized protein n=1 Tax=Mycena rosella TaxID=1033263 RepID=A0AAD7GB75_MYCRO|nr:hypothetical protein B0H17DRAFT_152570 [Mycena rosella]
MRGRGSHIPDRPAKRRAANFELSRVCDRSSITPSARHYFGIIRQYRHPSQFGIQPPSHRHYSATPASLPVRHSAPHHTGILRQHLATMDHLDRLAANTQAIRAAASCSLPPSPFARAVLDASLGDLIRDIEPAELGLFTPQLARVEFQGPAAPRRKQEPEVYAQAAFTYIDRYNAIRPMPRAYVQVVAILDQLAATRDSIRTLTATLEQARRLRVLIILMSLIPHQIQPSELKPLADQEEQRVRDLQARLADLKQRKDAPPKPRNRIPRTKPPVPNPPSTPPSKLDETFHTPAAAGRTLRFTDNLLMDDELMDLADVSVTSPIAPSRIQERPSLIDDPGDETDEIAEEIAEDTVDEPIADREQDDEDKTIMLPPKPAVAPPPMFPVQPPPTDTPKKEKLRVNTEVERIVAKIWSSAGDLIMPGHPFDTARTGTGSKPPRAKETIAHLQTVAALTPTPASPSTTISSLTGPASTAPTPQQILTAHLLLALLATGPNFSMPLNKVKEALAAKASASGGAGGVLGGQSTTRALYACVAKRLVKIERGGGEQVVKFDL